MPRTAQPLLSSGLTPDQERRQRARVVARANRIRHRQGETLSPTGRIQRIPYFESILVCQRRDRELAHEREARGLAGFVRGLRALTFDRRVPRASRAFMQRRHRLLALKPPGVDALTWLEIVDYARCLCLAPECGRPASRASFLEDGTPYPACAQHGTHCAG